MHRNAPATGAVGADAVAVSAASVSSAAARWEV